MSYNSRWTFKELLKPHWEITRRRPFLLLDALKSKVWTPCSSKLHSMGNYCGVVPVHQRCGTVRPTKMVLRCTTVNVVSQPVWHRCQCGTMTNVLRPFDHSACTAVQLVVIRSALAHANCDQLLDHIVEQFVCFSALLVRIPPADCVLYTVYSMSTL